MPESRPKPLGAAPRSRPGVRLSRLIALASVCGYSAAHVASQATALFGDASHSALCRWASLSPARLLAPAMFYLPLLFLGALWLDKLRRGKEPRSSHGEVGLGAIAVVFFGLHWSHMGLPYARGQPALHISADLVSSLSSTHAGVPVVALLYLAGLSLGTRCLVSGLERLLRAFPRISSVVASRLSWLTGGLCFALGCSAIVRLATGAPPW